MSYYEGEVCTDEARLALVREEVAIMLSRGAKPKRRDTQNSISPIGNIESVQTIHLAVNIFVIGNEKASTETVRQLVKGLNVAGKMPTPDGSQEH